MQETLTYLVVENKTIVNLAVGTADTSFEDWIKQTYPVQIGWIYNEEASAFIPADMTFEQFDILKSNTLSYCYEQKNYYDILVASQHFTNNLNETKQKEVNSWLEFINKKITLIENEPGYATSYHLNMVDEYLAEPFSIRPNIENEV
jgi:hypothetical protein